MKLDNFLAGIAILRKYTASEYPLDGAHDLIYFSTDRAVSSDDHKELHRLDWIFGPDDCWFAFT